MKKIGDMVFVDCHDLKSISIMGSLESKKDVFKTQFLWKVNRIKAELLRRASGEFLACLVPDMNPTAGAAGEGAARDGDDSPDGHIAHRLQGLTLRIENLVPSSRLRDDNLPTPPYQLACGTAGKRRDLLPVRIIHMIPTANIIDIRYLPLLGIGEKTHKNNQ